MKLLTRRPKAKRREVKFTPDWSARSGHGRLEGRALTAPAIFRRPTGFPTPPDLVTATANGSVNSGVQSANNAASASNGTLSLIAKSDIAVIDLGNPGAPWAPIGTHAASFATASQVNVAGGFGFLSGGAGTTFRRDYRLADTVGSTTPVSVVQRYTYNATVSGAGTWVPTGSLQTPNLTVTVTGGSSVINMGPGTTPVSITSGPASGTITVGARTLTYSIDISFASRSVMITDTQPIGALPTAGYTVGGDAVGIPWLVTASDGIGGTFAGPALGKVSSTYSIDLV